MITSQFRYALAVVLVGVLAVSAGASQITGFEVSDGFTVGGSWPAGWSGSASVSTANPAGGAQSIALSQSQNLVFSPFAAVSEPTELSVDICTSAHVPDEAFNFASYGHLYVYRQDYYFAGGLYFFLNDADDALGGYDLPAPAEYQIVFWNTSASQAEVVGAFAIDTWYRYTLSIDPSASTVTHNLALLDGTPVAERTYANSVTSVPQVYFYGSQAPSPAYVDNAYFGEPIPEPATATLLVLGGLALIRRRRK